VGLLLIRLVRGFVKKGKGIKKWGIGTREKDGKEAKSFLYAKSLSERLTRK
jgi:hypothetical protein